MKDTLSKRYIVLSKITPFIKPWMYISLHMKNIPITYLY